MCELYVSLSHPKLAWAILINYWLSYISYLWSQEKKSFKYFIVGDKYLG